jgi:hypothetical protein
MGGRFMHSVLAKALQVLDISELQLFNNHADVIEVVSFEAHAKALFTLLELANYLQDELIDTSVDYLTVDKAFAVPTEVVKIDLKKACHFARQSGQFNAEIFLNEFAKQDYFTVPDIVDLITFLQQTAFDRMAGVERDRLQAQDWMTQNAERFLINARQLGIITPLPPRAREYCVNAVMGASAPRVRSRINYRKTLDDVSGLRLGESWALSGKRELSKGLDDEETMEAVARSIGKPINYVEKPQGKDRRVFLDGVFETMMVNYLLEQICQGKNFQFLDSPVEKNHWRATAQQNATDIAPVIVDRILNKKLLPGSDNIYHIMIIAEQPYVGRMTRAIQRAFNEEIQKRQLDIKLIVEPCGQGIIPKEYMNPEKIKVINSELGSLIAERYKDASLRLKAEYRLRSPEIIMFSSRDEKYAALCKAKLAASAPPVTDLFAVAAKPVEAPSSNPTDLPPSVMKH